MKAPEVMAARSKGVINLSFNQDQECFSCCMETGLRIFNVAPLVELSNYDLQLMGSIAHCELLYRTNYIAIVSGGSHPKFSNKTVMIYNDEQKKFVYELNFTSEVKAIRLRRNKIVVVTYNQINVFSFPSPIQRLYVLETRKNDLGLCEISPVLTSDRQLLVFPGHKQGSVQLMDLATTEASISSSPVNINAHQGELAYLALNSQGTMVATASDHGTLIRVWDTTRRVQLVELRRGSDSATLYCINFSRNSEFLCCCSDKGTIHIFALKDTTLNRRSSFSKVGVLGHYGQSQWSLATYTLPAECASICAFSTGNSVVAICMDGSIHNYNFTNDGSCNRESCDSFLNISDER